MKKQKTKKLKRVSSNKTINNSKSKSETKNILYFVLILIITTLLSTALHMILLHTGLFKNIDVLFYRGIVLLILVLIIIVLALYLIKDRYLKISIKDIICIAIVILSFNLTFFTLVPVTIDRSITVFTLGKYNEAYDNSLSKEEMEKIFIDEYVFDRGAFDKRFKEQVTTGSIKKDENSDKYILTNRGKNLIKIFEIIGKMYNVDLSNMSK